MKTVSSRSREVAELIRDRVSFKTYGALRAETVSMGTMLYSGHLLGPDLDRWHKDWARIDYIVWSYSTPIAWHTDKGWHRVAQKFSMTTSHHQGKLYLIP